MPALKLLLAFNRSNHCFRGDAALYEAHERLVHEAKALYADGPRVRSDLFTERADPSELQYLRDRWSIDFDDDAVGRSDAAPDLESCLADLSDVDLDPLIAALDSDPPASDAVSAEWLMNRLYYKHLVHASAPRARHLRRGGRLGPSIRGNRIRRWLDGPRQRVRRMLDRGRRFLGGG
jgi:hypothetical protein